jgi:hypothetical protein
MIANSINNPLTQRPTRQAGQRLAALFIIVLLAAGCRPAQTENTGPPPDFQFVAEVDLSAQAYDEEILGELTLAETADVAIFYTIPNLNTSGFDLSLKGQNDDRVLILHSEDFQTDENGGGTWEKNLMPGTYRLALTAAQSDSVLSVYWKYPSNIE